MNYIKQINHYWQKHDECSLSHHECALYMYLLRRCNLLGWQNPVEIWNSTVMEALNLKFRALQQYRERLQQCNLIHFKTMNGSPVVIYLIYDAESKNKPETFFKSMALATKMYTKADADALAGAFKEAIDKLKEEEKPPVAAQVVKKSNHEVFCDDFFTPEHEYDRHALCIQLRVPEIKMEWVKVFNSHLITERKHHEKYHEWQKHLRSWLQLKLPEQKKTKYDNRNQGKSEYGKIKVGFSL